MIDFIDFLEICENISFEYSQMYSEYLKEKVDDPFWKDILNGSYENINSHLDILKSEI